MRFSAAIPFALMALIGAGLALGLTRDPRQLPSMLIDRPLPAFDLPAIANGGGFSSADVAGKVALINVFASWCSACRVEHPTLMRLAAAKRAPIYGVDWKDKAEDGAAWLRRYGDPYVATGLDFESRLAIELGVTGAPETYIVDKSGRIRYKQIGPITDEVWAETIEPLVASLEQETGS
ncbi:MAG: DsbE family thiol:disulfide interchange protein [Parvularculaceae bacterium]|nr:DsbE family thiol:disulfide interchange protein [Parvularculaceae bacterium]